MFLIKDWLNGFFGQFLTTYRLFLLNKLLVIRSILTRSVLFFVLHFICLFIIFISYVFQPLFLLHVFFFSLLCCDDLWLCCNFQLNCQVLFFMSWYVFFFSLFFFLVWQCIVTFQVVLLFSLTSLFAFIKVFFLSYIINVFSFLLFPDFIVMLSVCFFYFSVW
jgi:hypothetical protein